MFCYSLPQKHDQQALCIWMCCFLTRNRVEPCDFSITFPYFTRLRVHKWVFGCTTTSDGGIGTNICRKSRIQPVFILKSLACHKKPNPERTRLGIWQHAKWLTLKTSNTWQHRSFGLFQAVFAYLTSHYQKTSYYPQPIFIAILRLTPPLPLTQSIHSGPTADKISVMQCDILVEVSIVVNHLIQNMGLILSPYFHIFHWLPWKVSIWWSNSNWWLTYPSGNQGASLHCMKQWQLSVSTMPSCKENIYKMGQFLDLHGHLFTACNYMHDLIQQAHCFIYNLGKNVTGAAIEHLLSEHLWVPTLVCSFTVIQLQHPPYHILLELVWWETWHFWLWPLHHTGGWLDGWIQAGYLEGCLDASCKTSLRSSSCWVHYHRIEPDVCCMVCHW